ncbi:MAG: zinc ribbon domain-containing protein, partial [Gammaproteobacteria bacterium]|nr:zinc ribbon domain-containing protein [Gammaproteobacteria bacterium]
MNCLGCKAPLAIGSRFCEGCGMAVHLSCASCGEPCAPTANFCAACGAALGAKASVQARPAAAPQVVAKAELKLATVLFADIVGSTELVAGLDPEQAMQQLGPAVDAMADAVRRYDGTLGRTLGDGILAFFGAPHAHEGHALLACQAALDMLAASTQFPGIRIRVGLHSGEVVTDSAQSGSTRESQMHGLAIHLASRIVALAEPGTACMSEDSFLLLRSYYDALALGPRSVKGFDRPVEVYRLLGPKPSVSSDAFRGLGLTRLRGRERELDALRQALSAVEDGMTSVIG